MTNLKQDDSGLTWLEPVWSAPSNIRAVSTTRVGGGSAGPYHALNLGVHVGDNPETVTANRQQLAEALSLSNEPVWLNQIHGCDVVELPADIGSNADASWADEAGNVCVVMTADCLPVLICNAAGTEVAAAHAGWRGLCDGVIESAINRFTSPPNELLVWLGPAIGPQAFEVGAEVREAFMAQDEKAASAIVAGQGDKWMADIFALARMRLQRAGINSVYGGGICTYSDEERFFSYRRDGVTGRMATMIWIERG